MFPEKAEFFVDMRKNVHAPKGEEWVLKVSLDGKGAWTVFTWDDEPSRSEVHRARVIAMRSFEVYHNHIKLPSFCCIGEGPTRTINDG